MKIVIASDSLRKRQLLEVAGLAAGMKSLKPDLNVESACG